MAAAGELLWERIVWATIGQPGEEGVRVGTSAAGDRGLDIDFAVEHTDASEPNKARITIWNPAPRTVAEAQDPEAEIRLMVGHAGGGDGVARQIFKGNPTRGGVRYDRQAGGASRALVIEARDGGRAYSTGRVSRSYATATTPRQVFDDLAAEVGLSLGSVDLGEASEFPGGLALAGTVRRHLDELAASLGRRWFVRDGALYVVAEGEPTGAGVTLFSSTEGNLVGSPVPTDKGIEVRALIAPTLRPGKLFRVESADYSGVYRCTDLSFEGSSYGGPFYVVARGRPRR